MSIGRPQKELGQNVPINSTAEKLSEKITPEGHFVPQGNTSEKLSETLGIS